MSSPCPVICVSGTDTEIGKTIATAAIAAALTGHGQRVVAVKPTQTGLAPGEPGDADEVARLSGVDVREYVRLPEPLAPDIAGRRAGVALPTVAEHAVRIADLARSGDYDVVLVEGAGGLLVRLDADGGTLADLATALGRDGVRAGFAIVVRAGLGTLNHTALTLEALKARDLDLVGLIVGSLPDAPDLAAETNLDQLRDLADGRWVGAIPQGAAGLAPEEFSRAAGDWVVL
ncbi:dethiobiotin synthase [Allobranchiibius sp. CTAmp26]|uniref:dethiobiotin synthase n=1 Tax=Allobranchiibius sp. CTAmp26 TaxID=2815214 RepID=UPI001AA1A431|nr:dethiobiotin synthase [Allobranchiibius sp. CTAmp26]MBO1754852.1 ATP-dependent dethiobiotin synthetase BioD [Allobranchiibius sp. CTAmp26]